MIEFAAWPKTPRLFRDMVVTEKIDGTNAGVHVIRLTNDSVGRFDATDPDAITVVVDGSFYQVAAQSRRRIITPTSDNFGFANWVWENAHVLIQTLGEGVHYGEWWGSGIQRGYGLEKGEKRFSLFNVNRWQPDLIASCGVPGLGVVPTLYTGTFDTAKVEYWLACLEQGGSFASPGFDRPEGVIVYHTAAGRVFKALIENDDIPKGDSA